MSRYTSSLDLRFKSYEVFKISAQVRACCQPLPMQQNLPFLPKFAKICPKTKLWNTTKNRDFSFFPRPKISTCMLFLLSKNGLCMWTLNLMILQTVWNEWVRFGGHINIQVSFKILELEVLKKALILHNPTCFQEGLFWGNFGLMRARVFRG
jgi:hypothetical protein